MLDGSSLQMAVWKPDTYFVQSKKGTFSNNNEHNIILSVRSDGKVFYRSR